MSHTKRGEATLFTGFFLTLAVLAYKIKLYVNDPTDT